LSLESKAVRAFVAIPVPGEVLARLAEVQRELKALLPRHSTAWTKPENMHLTLCFLGDLAPPAIPVLGNQLQAALAGFGELGLICERLGCFPDLRYPRVVWAWVHDANERLQHLQQRIDAAVREFTEKPADARFVGHITLARPKQIKRTDAESLRRFVDGAVSRDFGNWPARDVVLMRSELSPAGSTYSELARASLV
jgi:RNA 2',3'-cyclic 3'-phosphodiesterase